MKSLLFVLFLTAVLSAGLFWLRARMRRLGVEREERSRARAEQFLAATGLAGTIQPPPRQSNGEPDTGWAAPAAPPASAPEARAMPSARRLRKISRGRFARIGLAYFESAGFRVQRFHSQQAPEAPIDALLFMGGGGLPTMALRWARTEDARAPLAEVRAFAEACAALRIPRSTFIAQHGLDEAAADFADTRGIVCLDAEALALKLADAAPDHRERLLDIVHQGRPAAS